VAYNRTLLQLRGAVRAATDTVEASGVYDDSWLPDDQLDHFINLALGDLYNMQVQSGLSQNESKQDITGTGATRYTLPDDFYAPLYCYVQTSSNTWSEISQIHLRELNYFRNLQGSGSGYPVVFRTVDRTYIDFYPAPNTGRAIEFYYVPNPPILVEDTDEYNFGNVWNELVEIEAAIKVLQKAEDSTTQLERRKEELLKRIEVDVEHLSMTQGMRMLRKDLRQFDIYPDWPRDDTGNDY